MKQPLLALGLVAALAGPQVHAANSDNITNSGLGDTVLVMKNFDNTETLIWDLSVGLNDLTAADFYNTNASFSISDATVTTWINDNAGLGDISFNIFGLSEVKSGPGFPPPPHPNVGGVVTVANLAPLGSGNLVQSQVDLLQTQIDANVNPAGLPDNGVLVITDPASSAFFGNGNHDANLFGSAATGTVGGGPLDFYYIQMDPNLASVLEQTGQPALNTLLGQFELTPAALTYTAVPVPAAVWLFGSALIGLVGIRRRA